MGLDDTDIKQLEKILLENPQKGDVIQNSGGARKLRIQLEGRGKRGGGRVIYVDIFEKEKLYLLLAYPKNVQDNLTASQLKLISEIIDTIKRE
ncbi:MAG: type II toxin-antitoxin system RelE/ParE family toxin [Acutalibacteraceae bacterium]